MKQEFAPIVAGSPAERALKGPGARRAPSLAFLNTAARQLRDSLEAAISPGRLAAALTEACSRWRERGYGPRYETLSSAARGSGFSLALLDESMDALLQPFHAAAFQSLAARVASRPLLMGFVMPGNVIGAGLHEFCQSLLGGAAAMVKTSCAEPRFFAALASTLREVDPQVGARVSVMNWGRGDIDQTAALKNAIDYLVAFGDDQSVASLAADVRLIGFGSRASAAVVACGCDRSVIADSVARDVTLFEQRGCLSPHHVFVEDPSGQIARDFAGELARSLEVLARRFPPARLALRDAAAIRSARENARWRRIGGQDSQTWERAATSEKFGWTVIYDASARFCFSPGYRTVYVSPFRDLADLALRLQSAAGRIEAVAVADPLRRFDDLTTHLRAIGASYLAIAGEMQSPPLDWRHGGGALLDLFLSAR